MGFDRPNVNSEADTECVFEAAVNRAQETLAAIFPLYEEVTLFVRDLTPCLSVDRYTLPPARRRTWTCEGGRAYSFSARGEGDVIISRDGVPYAHHRINSPITDKFFAGELPKNALVSVAMSTLEGTLTLHDLQVLPEIQGAVTKRKGEIDYRLDALAEGAVALDAPPLGEDGCPLVLSRDYRVQNGTLTLSDRIEGKLKLTITRMPRHFDLSCESPDVRAEAMPLLPLLVAAYVWLDDDREKAMFYLAMYRESLSRSMQNGRTAGVGCGYSTVNGW